MTPKLHRLAALLILAGLSSCIEAPEDAEAFWQALAEEKCHYWSQCEAEFEDEFADEDACISRHFYRQGNPSEFADQCPDYQPEEAQRCLKYIRKQTRGCDTVSRSAWDDACGYVCGTFGVEKRTFAPDSWAASSTER